MKKPDLIKQLANRINQPHVVESWINKIEKAAYNKGYKDAESKQCDIPVVVGSFVLYRVGAIDNVYWNGKEFTPYKDNIPTYTWDKANEYAKLLNCNFCDK